MNHVESFTHSPVKASSIIGTDVVDVSGNDIGDVKEVVIDPHSGKVAYAVVAFGGFLGMGEKLFAIPFSALKYQPEHNSYSLDISKEKLKKAPGFDKDDWPTMSTEQWNRDVYEYYDAHPYWEQ